MEWWQPIERLRGEEEEEEKKKKEEEEICKERQFCHFHVPIV